MMRKSACLLGMCTRYDGESLPVESLVRLAARGRVLPVCPEVAAGLPVPRPPAEIVGGGGDAVLDGVARVVTPAGVDVTAAFVVGAQRTLEAAYRLLERGGRPIAVLKSHSPSCGSRQIYDGSFGGRLVPGMGVAAALLRRHGIAVYDENVFLEELER